MQSVRLRVSCLGPVSCLAWLGGGGLSGSPHAWLGVECPLTGGSMRPGRSGAGGAGRRGAACLPSSLGAWPGGPEGPGVALPRSVPLTSLGGHQSRCRSVHGGRGLHTSPVRVPVLTLSVVRVAPLCAGAGSPACRGLCGSRQVAAWVPGVLAWRRSPPGCPGSFGGGGRLLSLGG